MTLGPNTKLHYTAGANLLYGNYNAPGDPGADGFNLADVSSLAAADALPAGDMGLIWINGINGVTASFQKMVKAAAADPKVFGFFNADYPNMSQLANLAAENAYIAKYAPGKQTFILAENVGSDTAPVYKVTPTNTGSTLIGLDPSPVGSQYAGGMNLQVIDAAVAAALKAGWSLSQIVPVYQVSGSGSDLPTADQEQAIMAEWAKLVPTPVFDYAFNWGQQSGNTSLSMSTALQAVFAEHNGVSGTTSSGGTTGSGGTVTPVLTGLTDSPAGGVLTTGSVLTLTLAFNEAVTVAGGTPTLTLNDGGVATYASGSGSSSLVFTHTVPAGVNDAKVTVTAVNLNGATITDGAGATASLSLSGITQAAPSIDSTDPVIAAITESPATGVLAAGKAVTLTVGFNEAVTVAGGTPTLTLNDGGVATYASGSGGSALTFTYTVAAGQNTSALAVTAFNLNGAAVKDSAGDALVPSLAGIAQAGPKIDTTAPTLTAISDSPATGTLTLGSTDTLTLAFSEAVTVAGGTPTLTLNDGGTASYVSGSGTGSLVFSTTVASGQTASSLAVTAVNLNGATIKDAAGNAAGLAIGGLAQSGPAVNAIVAAPPPVTPVITALTDTPATGVLSSGGVVTLTLAFNEAVTVAGGTPTLTLNDGGVASYVGGSGTGALAFSTTVAAGQNASGLAATAVNLNGAAITDAAGNTATLSLSGITQAGPRIDTTAPAISAITETPASGVLAAGGTVTLTLAYSEAVTVAGGVPTLTLNDGGVASYVSGSGTGALSFSTTVAAGQNTTALAATAVNLNGATIKDAAGNAASASISGIAQAGPQINTSTPVILSITDSPTTGAVGAGKTVTLTFTLSEAVTVAGGTPTLTLNDGGTATYSGGSGTSALTFTTTVAAGQNASALAATVVNLNGATIKDAAGNAATLTLAGIAQAGPKVDTTAPTVALISESPTSGPLAAGKTVTLTLAFSEAVTVAGATPTLTLNDGGVATYTGGSGTASLVFSTTVAAGQNASALAATAANLNGATITDAAGNAANLSLSGLTQAGPKIDTTAPTLTAISDSPATGTLTLGSTDTLTLAFSEAVTVAGGTPTLTLNDGGTASYVSGSGTGSLVFSTTVGSGQSASSLAATAVNLNGATVKDAAGNAASLTISGLAQTGPAVNGGTSALAGPVTPLHYTAGGNTAYGSYNAAGDPGADGFNLADVSSVSAADSLPTGVKGLIWVGDSTSVDAAFQSIVNASANDPKVYGFYVADEPSDSAIPNLKAMCDYIHQHAPGKMAFICAENNGSPLSPVVGITPTNTDADLIGLDPYPIRPSSAGSEFANGYNYSVIDAGVTAALKAGWALSQIVPVYQAFGGGGYSSWTMPTAAQEQQILAEWAKLTPNPAFDYAYAWGQQSNDTSLGMSSSLQAVFAQHNAIV